MSDNKPLADWQERATVPIPEAAKILSIGRGVAYAAAKAGQLPTLQFGKRKVVPTAALKRLLNGEAAA